MVVYGRKSKELLSESIHDKCANCGTAMSTDLYVFQNYAHVFWIPFFPLGKYGVSQCSHCKQVLKDKEFTPEIKMAYDSLKGRTKTPIWFFSGLALTAVLIVIAFISEQKNAEANAKLILAPKAGDVFEVKTKESQFTLYKVNLVEGDSVFLQFNNYETSRIKGLGEINRKGESAYTEELYGFSKAELKEMLDKGEIIDINR